MATSTLTASSHPATQQSTVRGWVDFVLLLFMMVNLALSLDAANWSPGLGSLFIIATIAVIAGVLVAISDFGPVFSFIYSLITGSAAILYTLSRLAVGNVTGQARVYQIIERTLIWFQDILNGQPGSDTLVFVLLLAVLIWILSFNATWVYFRENRKWQAILPTGLAMLVNLYYAPVNLKAYFVLYLITAMLLLIRSTLAEREQRWYSEKIYFPFDIGFDVMRDGVLFVLFVVAISWVLPTALSDNNQDVLTPFQDPWKQMQETWNRLFNTLNYGEESGGIAPSVVFSINHPLGGSRSLTDAPVMDVTTTLNRYYQATVLDTYSSNAWSLRNTVKIDLSPQGNSVPQFSARREIEQTVTMLQLTNVLMGAPMPIAVSVPASAKVIPVGMTPEEALSTQNVGISELAFIISDKPIQPGQSFTITSSISFATESQLRSDSTVYPPDIRARYLQLPDTVPQRVFDLADDLAAGKDNPYDIAKAVEAYVRKIPYNDAISGPAPDQDAADYFLFEEKQGYCDYYATSMAVMLRHLGIPTRLAQGYATGDFQNDVRRYRLLEKDAHTWVEVYFPTYGWIQFEPTASEPLVNRQQSAIVPPQPGGRSSAVERNTSKEKEDNIPQPKENIPQVGQAKPATLWKWLGRHIGALLLGSALLALVFVIMLLRRVLRMPDETTHVRVKKAPRDFMERLWEKLLTWGGRLGMPLHASQTPLEQAVVFANALPEISDEVTTLALLYARDKYSSHPLVSEEIDRAQLSWLRIRSRAIRAWLDRLFHVRHLFSFWIKNQKLS